MRLNYILAPSREESRHFPRIHYFGERYVYERAKKKYEVNIIFKQLSGSRLNSILMWWLMYPHHVKKSIMDDDINHFFGNTAYLLSYINPKYSIVTLYGVSALHLKHYSLPRLLFSKDYGRLNDVLLFRLGIKSLKRARRIITISKYSKNDIVNSLGYPAEKVVVAYFGVDPYFKELENKEEVKRRIRQEYKCEGKKIILYVGTENPRKNIPTLIKAFYKLKKDFKDIVLFKVGPENPNSRLRDLVSSLNLENDVRFIGQKSGEELVYFYNAADVFVLPSIFESFPLVALEAAACGVPLVISIGAKAFVGDFGEDAIFTVDPKSIDSISNGIVEALNDEVSKEKVKLAQNRIKKYSWLERAKKVAEIYEKVMSR